MDDLITTNLRGFEFKFKTKPGIFSKQGIDLGTRLLVENMEIEGGSVIADLGCGTGVIGMIAAKLNEQSSSSSKGGHIHLLDDHLRSVELAKENVELNSLKNVEVFLSDLFSAVSERTYHQIFSNPPQQLGNEFLEELINESFKHLKPQGSLWLVVKKNLKPVIERMINKTFGNHSAIAQGKDHVVFKASRR